MTSSITFHKVLNSLPVSLEPNAHYYVLGQDNTIEFYIVNETGTEALRIDSKSPNLFGPNTILCSQSKEFKITNYDSNTNYNISIDDGSAVINNDIITVTGSINPKIINLTINNRKIPINVVSEIIEKPIIISPVNNASGIGISAIIEVDDFNCTNGDSLPDSAEWQVATDIDFTNVVYYQSTSGDDIKKLTIIGLSNNTNYYVRMRYFSNLNNFSIWSDTVKFTTEINFTPNTLIADILSNDNQKTDYFGYSITSNNDSSVFAIGAYNYNFHGAVFIYEPNINGFYEKTALLLPQDLINGLNFGRSISLSGDGNTIVIGAYMHTDNSYTGAGAAYIFERIGGVWTQTAKLVTTDQNISSAYFGFSVDVSRDGNTIVVGCYGGKNGAVTTSGKAYVYTRVLGVWTLQTSFGHPSPANTQYMGYSVAINENGTYIVVGGYRVTVSSNTYAGVACVYKKTAGVWSLLTTLTASDSVASLYFGYRVIISGDGSKIGVYAYQGRSGSIICGAVYMFTINGLGTGYTQVAKLIPPVPRSSSVFGNSITMSNDGTKLLINYYTEYYLTTGNVGAVYVYSLIAGVWTLQTTLYPDNKVVNKYFGYYTDINYNGNMALITSINNSNIDLINKPSVGLYV